MIKGLERIRDYDPMFRVTHDDEFSQYAADAIALLKAQEPRECEDTNQARIFCCSVCGYKVEDIFIDERKFEYPSINFCPNCGRVVKWE